MTNKFQITNFKILIIPIIIFGLFCVAKLSLAANWSGILDPSRAIDWSNAGIPGGIPNRAVQCGPTIAAYAGTAATINTAIASCASGQYVHLGTGTFNLSSGIIFNGKSNVTLRGDGPTNTIVVFSGSGVSCASGNENICATSNPVYWNGSPTTQPGGTNAADWTTGYAKGTTSITLNNVGSNVPTNGTVLILDQANDQAAISSATESGNTVTITTTAAHGWTTGNTVVVSGVSVGGYNGTWTITGVGSTTFTYTNTSSNLGNGSGGYAVVDTGGAFICDVVPTCNTGAVATGRIINGVMYAQQQYVIVQNIIGSGNGPYTVTISPGLYANNWRANRSPKAWWSSTTIKGDGIENLTIDNTATGSNVKADIAFQDCDQCYVKNIRSILANRNHVWFFQSNQGMVIDSYFYNTLNAASQSYGIELYESGDVLVQNNIFDYITVPIMEGSGSGNVFAYNFSANNRYDESPNWMQASYASHDAGNQMNLFEGNDFNGIFCDDLHGTSALSTLFRNSLSGWQLNKIYQTISITFDYGCRGYNIIGNVLGTAGYHNNYEASPTTGPTNCYNSIYDLGWAYLNCNQNSPPSMPPSDNLVMSTLMRWGNYDTVNAAVQWNSSEVPASGVPYINGNPIPSNHILPDSFYLTAKPSWWSSTIPWPPIGPDVTGGNVSGLAGHVYKIPAHVCYDNDTKDTNGILTDFNADICYGNGSSSDTTPPAAPTGVSVN